MKGRQGMEPFILSATGRSVLFARLPECPCATSQSGCLRLWGELCWCVYALPGGV